MQRRSKVLIRDVSSVSDGSALHRNINRHLDRHLFIFLLYISKGTGSFLGVKRPGRGVIHPPHLAPRLKKE